MSDICECYRLEMMLNQQIKNNLILAQDLSDKETINYDLNLLVVSLATDLIKASDWIKDGEAEKIYKAIANNALDSITDKGEKG